MVGAVSTPGVVPIPGVVGIPGIDSAGVLVVSPSGVGEPGDVGNDSSGVALGVVSKVDVFSISGVVVSNGRLVVSPSDVDRTGVVISGELLIVISKVVGTLSDADGVVSAAGVVGTID